MAAQSTSQSLSPGILRRLYNHNPFYVISTVLMLYAVLNSYGELKIGSINCWIMMGVLGSYTLTLSVIAILIVRFGKVWEDARSILLLLLLLFLGVSVSADDLFVKMESTSGGTLLMIAGFTISSIITEVTLRGIGLKMNMLYRVPLHAFLALFYLAPWWCSPELHPRDPDELEWTITLFPLLGAAILLSLLPAVRRGPEFVANNGSPWRWPLYPWCAFGMITIALAIRSFVLAMTFGPTGPIWVNLKGGSRAIAFDTMWGPYFLIPIVVAILVLMLETGFVTANQKLIQCVLKFLPIIVPLAYPVSHGAVFRGFYNQFTAELGSPIWLAVWICLGLYAMAWLRGVSMAGIGALTATASLSLIGPHTIGFSTMTELQPIPLAIAGAGLLVHSIYVRSSFRATVAALVLVVVEGLFLSESSLSHWKMTLCFHTFWGALLIFGLTFRDDFAEALRMISAIMIPLASLAAMLAPQAAEVSILIRIGYVVAITCLGFLLARYFHSRWFLWSSLAVLGLIGYEVIALGFRTAATNLGTGTITALAWSVGSLLTGVLISSHKAKWLPEKWFPAWKNGKPASTES